MDKPTAAAEKLTLKELVALGVGGMVGGGIFSVLGLSVTLAGHAAPVAFAVGGLIALITGISYTRLGHAFHSDGGSFTYLEHAFRHKNISGIGGWLLLTGYIGTLALYSYTFGVYGSAMFGDKVHVHAIQHLLESMVLLVFLSINLYGIKLAGKSEDVIVLIKVLILGLFAAVGLVHLRADHLLPVFNRGGGNAFMGAALIFVAYEGFELIPNTVNEMEDPARNLGRAIILSILITTFIYILVSLVAVGNLLPDEINRYKEYALAVAAKPFLGHFGFMLIGLGALLSTASAINATLFGTARLGMVMAQEEELPRVFSLKEKTQDIPYVSLTLISTVTLIFVNSANLTIISSFASATFLLLFAMIHLCAIRLRNRIGLRPLLPAVGFVLSAGSLVTLLGYLYQNQPQSLLWITILYATVVVLELGFSKRRILAR